MPDRRFPLSATTRLWQLAARETGDENLGLWVSRHSTHTTFHALGYAFMASRTLLEAMQRVVRFNGMVSDAANVELLSIGDNYALSWALASDTLRPADEAMEAVIAAILRACRRLSGRDFHPLKVRLSRARPRLEKPFNDFFRCEIEYDALGYGLEFLGDDLERPLPESNEDLARSNDRLGEEYLARLDLGSVTTRLRTLLANELPSGIRSHENYARLLGMSGRSLQRKLSAEGTSFNQVLNETRCALAKSYLAAGQRHSLTEIAFLLGFSDASSFSRAFHRWTGVAPSAYSS
jgi:AraC-like DNA-binding protein